MKRGYKKIGYHGAICMVFFFFALSFNFRPIVFVPEKKIPNKSQSYSDVKRFIMVSGEQILNFLTEWNDISIARLEITSGSISYS